MFTIELIGLLIGIVLIASLPITLVCFVYNHILEQREKVRPKYYIVNKTGNIFREYEDEITRDHDLECFNAMGYQFEAQNYHNTKQ